MSAAKDWRQAAAYLVVVSSAERFAAVFASAAAVAVSAVGQAESPAAFAPSRLEPREELKKISKLLSFS